MNNQMKYFVLFKFQMINYSNVSVFAIKIPCLKGIFMATGKFYSTFAWYIQGSLVSGSELIA